MPDNEYCLFIESNVLQCPQQNMANKRLVLLVIDSFHRT